MCTKKIRTKNACWYVCNNELPGEELALDVEVDVAEAEGVDGGTIGGHE